MFGCPIDIIIAIPLLQPLELVVVDQPACITTQADKASNNA